MIINKKNSKIIRKAKNTLGEGLYVSSVGIFWLDIINKKLFVNYVDGRVSEFTLPEMASCIWKVEKPLVYIVSVSGICIFNLITKYWNVLAKMPSIKSRPMRANDGVEFNKGYCLFGTMELEPTGENGALYIYNGENITELYHGIGIPNSFIKVSESSFLITDSLKRKVYSFTLNKHFNAIEKKVVWLDLSDSKHTPDGGCCDDKGNIYLSMWDGSCVNKYDKNANLLSIFELPVKRPTNCKLSYNGKSIIVTTAREGLSEEELALSPESGSLFQIGLK